MKNDDRLQIPINKKLKKDLQKKCESIGFSSFNEAIRVILHNFTYANNPLLNNYNQEIFVDPYIEELDEETEKAIDKAYLSHKKGESISLNLNDKDWFEKLQGHD